MSTWWSILVMILSVVSLLLESTNLDTVYFWFCSHFQTSQLVASTDFKMCVSDGTSVASQHHDWWISLLSVWKSPECWSQCQSGTKKETYVLLFRSELSELPIFWPRYSFLLGNTLTTPAKAETKNENISCIFVKLKESFRESWLSCFHTDSELCFTILIVRTLTWLCWVPLSPPLKLWFLPNGGNSSTASDF